MLRLPGMPRPRDMGARTSGSRTPPGGSWTAIMLFADRGLGDQTIVEYPLMIVLSFLLAKRYGL